MGWQTDSLPCTSALPTVKQKTGIVATYPQLVPKNEIRALSYYIRSSFLSNPSACWVVWKAPNLTKDGVHLYSLEPRAVGTLFSHPVTSTPPLSLLSTSWELKVQSVFLKWCVHFRNSICSRRVTDENSSDSSVGHIFRCSSDSALTQYLRGPWGICCRLCLLRNWQEACRTYFVSSEGQCQEPHPLRIKTLLWRLIGLSNELRETLGFHLSQRLNMPENT